MRQVPIALRVLAVVGGLVVIAGLVLEAVKVPFGTRISAAGVLFVVLILLINYVLQRRREKAESSDE